jgi:hypothetical protein
VLLHGSEVISSLIASRGFVQSKQFGYNLQTYAVILVAIHGLLYTIHCNVL